MAWGRWVQFTRALGGHFGIKLISVGIAILLWMIILGSQKVEVDKEVPLKILTASGFVPANDIPQKVTFRLSGPKGFLRTVLERAESPIEVDLRKSEPGLVTYRFFSDDITVPLGVKVLSINPTAVFIRLEEVRSKFVNVNLDLYGKMPTGYQIRSMEVDPPQVRVKGAESRLKKITEISTKPIPISDLRQNLEMLADLDLSRYHLELEGDPPRILLDVEAVAASFKIRNVRVVVKQASLQSQLSDKTVTVFVRAKPEALEGLDQSKVFAEVSLKGKGKGKYTRRLKVRLPKDVTLVRVVPESVQVTLY